MDKNGKISSFDVAATFACLGSLVFWSLGPICIKYLTVYIDLWTQNLLRYLISCIFWLPFLLFSLKSKYIRPVLWKRALVPAGINIVFQSLWAAIFYYINPAFAVLLLTLSVVWVAVFSIIFFAEERFLVRSPFFGLGLVFSILGVVGVTYYREDFAAGGTINGIILALVTSVAWAAYTLSAKIAFREFDSRHGFSIISIYTVVGLFVLTVIYGKPHQCLQMGALPWIIVIFSGLTAIAFGHVLYYIAMKRIGATVPAMVNLAQTFIVLAISRVLFGETLTANQIIFGLVLLGGSAFAILAQQHLKRNSS